MNHLGLFIKEKDKMKTIKTIFIILSVLIAFILIYGYITDSRYGEDTEIIKEVSKPLVEVLAQYSKKHKRPVDNYPDGNFSELHEFKKTVFFFTSCY